MDFETLHPLPEEIRERVVKELRRIETDHNVTVLYACESGSRAWGFASTNSDYDVRFVYVPKIDWHLDIDKQRNVIDSQIPEFDLDCSGWSLGKTLGLLRKSNPALLEWLGSPLVYMVKPERDELKEFALRQFNPDAGFNHYLNLAGGTWKRFIADHDEVIYKKYFYALRPLFAIEWVLKYGTMPPTEYEKLVADYSPGPTLQAALDKLLVLKRAGDETRAGPRIFELDEFIWSKLEDFRKLQVPALEKPDDEYLKEFFRRTVRKYD
ncbi:nucleotidyltransferase [Pseudomonas phage Psa21]|uniref:Nucleotidyltransferase n=1 Tax=Pseudomonas phage Psa21 TaxID=2530023 RepID=A0A481W492_9CAUD|nr:nucleotidyltransferase [Pseudomonas phage Psa21]QBJ02579.1 nucleotidyltransferase [Pseudomonas phage Psa21]